MNYDECLKNAIDYIEAHITERLDYADIARQACCSSYHFQRVFGIAFGISLGGYIRARRLTLAGNELVFGGEKVIDVALKYGYETPESFMRAFRRFNGVTPSEAKKEKKLKAYPTLSVVCNNKKRGDKCMKFRVEEKPDMILTGCKRRFDGVPFGDERAKQEEQFFVSTRAKQWLLRGVSCDFETDYCVIKNVTDGGYDFYICADMDEWTRREMYDPNVTGVDFMSEMNFETVVIPKQTYVVFETDKMRKPISDYALLRGKIMTELVPDFKYSFIDAPEVIMLHWRVCDRDRKFVEICLPIEKC